MPATDYYGIREEIRNVLLADADLTAIGLTVEIESEIDFGAEDVPIAFIYLESRTAPDGAQRLAAGTRTDFRLQFSIWCGHFSLESLEKAAEFRDDLIGKVEVALMKNRTLNNKVRTLWLTGGEFFLARDQESGFYSLGEVAFTVDAISTTV